MHEKRSFRLRKDTHESLKGFGLGRAFHSPVEVVMSDAPFRADGDLTAVPGLVRRFSAQVHDGLDPVPPERDVQERGIHLPGPVIGARVDFTEVGGDPGAAPREDGGDKQQNCQHRGPCTPKRRGPKRERTTKRAVNSLGTSHAALLS